MKAPFGGLGHSDADIVLHAVIDAILGVVGLGDIGDWFSDRDKKYKGMSSEKMLKVVIKEALAARWHPVHVDATVILEKPRLGPYKKKIRDELARMLGLKKEDVSIKVKRAQFHIGIVIAVYTLNLAKLSLLADEQGSGQAPNFTRSSAGHRLKPWEYQLCRQRQQRG